MDGVPPLALCSTVRAAINQSLIGAYLPQCEGDGSFSPVQCHESYCWCVHAQTGEPVGEMFRFQSTNPVCTSKMLLLGFVTCTCVD